MKLWINEHDFIEINDRKSLSTEIAPRSRSLDWMGIMGFLPDPDPVLRKLGQDITVYRQLLSDAHVWSCYQSRKSGTLSCEWEIKDAASGGRKSDKGAYNLIVDMMEDLDVYQIITDMLDAPFYGMSPMEVIWQSAAGKWLPDRVVGKPPEWFQFDPENNLRFKSVDDMIEGEEIPEYKFLLPKHHASYQNPYGERVLSRCFWPVVFKRGGFKYWAVFTEKFGMPWVRGKVPRGTGEPERARLLDNLTKMVADAVAVINDDESVEITEAAGKSASADIYEKLVSASNREVSKAILGQTLTTELDKGGSFAATKEHMEVRGDLVDQDKRMVIGAFNLLFNWIVELNFAGATPPKFGFFQEEDIQKERSDRDINLDKQVKFTKKYFLRTYNLEDDDFELRNNVPENKAPQNRSGEFAEGSDPDTADAFTDRLDEEAAGLVEDLIGPVRDLVQRAKSFEEIRDGLLDLYPDMDTSDLGAMMQQALTAAELSGRFEVSQGE
jgi:phage gp29-like protein